MPEEGEQSDGEGEQEAEPARVHAAQPGQPEHADGHRDHPDVEADQGHQAVEAEVGVGRLHRHVDRVVDGAAGGGEQQHLVGLPLDPGVLDGHGRGAQAADLLVGLAEVGEAVVHDRLLDLDRIGAVVSQLQLDLARLEHGALHGQLLLRHADAVEPGRVEQHEQADGNAQHEQRQQAGEPARRPLERLAGGGGGRLHQSLTPRRSPSTPVPRTRDTWAWNMYLPVYGKRSSRMPRSPWPWITVSVKSRGSRRVPVG